MKLENMKESTADILKRSLAGSPKKDGIREYPMAASVNMETTECVLCSEIIESAHGRVCWACDELYTDLMNADDCEIFTHIESCDKTCSFTCRPYHDKKCEKDIGGTCTRNCKVRSYRSQPWYLELVQIHKITMNKTANVAIDDYDEITDEIKVVESISYTGKNWERYSVVKDELTLSKVLGYVLGGSRIAAMLADAGMPTPVRTVEAMMVAIKAEPDWNVKLRATFSEVAFIRQHKALFVTANPVEREIIYKVKKSLEATKAHIIKTGKKMEAISDREEQRMVREARSPQALLYSKPLWVKSTGIYSNKTVGWITGGSHLGASCQCGSTCCDCYIDYPRSAMIDLVLRETSKAAWIEVAEVEEEMYFVDSGELFLEDNELFMEEVEIAA